MSLFVFLSIFSGLREFTLSYSNSSDPDFKIEPRIGKSFILSQEEESQLKSNKSIAFFLTMALMVSAVRRLEKFPYQKIAPAEDF